MPDTDRDSLDFTRNAWEVMYDAVDSTHFQDHDARLIYEALKKSLHFVSFGEYLKRYLYRKAGFDEPFGAIGQERFQQIIRDSFAETHTPASFEPASVKISALSRNWLTQQTVKRKVVFLLGFGLSMRPEEVNEFLTRALREREINAKDPFEVICWFCYRNHLGFSEYRRLFDAFAGTGGLKEEQGLVYEDSTAAVRSSMQEIRTEQELLVFTAKLRTIEGKPLPSVTARRQFDRLYNKARDLTAALYNRTEREEHEARVEQYQRILLANDRISDAKRNEMVRQKRSQLQHFTREDITESDLEHIISSAIPLDRHGNLTPGKASGLHEQFAGKRFSRQHISEILADRAEVTRFDLITLNFYVYSQTTELFDSARLRFLSFVETTNEILKCCSLGPLYIANPYECFVMMCILSEDPLGTYADVWEMSYQKDEM